jgi:hypothetical protein
LSKVNWEFGMVGTYLVEALRVMGEDVVGRNLRGEGCIEGFGWRGCCADAECHWGAAGVWRR